MRNAVVVSILWMLLSIPLPGQPHPVQQPTNTKGTESQRDQRGTKDSPMFVHILQDPQSEADAAKIKKSTQRKETVDLVTAWAAGLAAVFTGLLVVIGWRGVRAAVRTLGAIENQGKIMKRQADLMEAQFDQWAVLSNWRVEKLQSGPFEPFDMRLMVDLINPTAFPMALTGELKIDLGNPDSHYVYYIGENTFLAPQKPLVINLGMTFPADWATAKSVSFVVTGKLSHLHKINKSEIVQPVEGYLSSAEIPGTGGKWGCDYLSLQHMNPEKKTKEGDEKAN